jgi:hypothetical protein
MFLNLIIVFFFYLKISQFRGVWNVPFISEVVLINVEYAKHIPITYEDTRMDAVLTFPTKLREMVDFNYFIIIIINIINKIQINIIKKNVFMHASNMDYFGHLITPDNFNTSLVRPELYEIQTNPVDWAERYIHPEYYEFVNGKNASLQVYSLSNSVCYFINIKSQKIHFFFIAVSRRFLVSSSERAVL